MGGHSLQGNMCQASRLENMFGKFIPRAFALIRGMVEAIMLCFDKLANEKGQV
ncbi:hypothetical protein D3C85_1426810 [compost metagenome]